MMRFERRLGLIAEDETDCATAKELVRRILEPRGVSYGFKTRHAGGCGAILQKGRAWIGEFARKGCGAIVIIQDLDRNPNNGEQNDRPKLRRTLEAIPTAGLLRCVCIPVEEMEAWFWSDPDLLKRFSSHAKASPSPELIKQPKERLRALSRDSGGKSWYSTQDNKDLATGLNLDLCAARCPSFRELRDFVLSLP